VKTPSVSVILTSFNHGKYIAEAINSVLEQTFEGFELLIWDDASTDNSWYLISQFADPRIKAFRNPEQKRAICGLNKAISQVASGQYIAIHHSDDVWEPDKLEKQVAFLGGHSDVGAVFTNALAIGEVGSPLLDESHFYFNVFDQPNRTRHEWLRFFFSGQNALCHPSVLIRKLCYENCGLYRLGVAQLTDLDMWIRLCMRYEIHVLPEKLVRFRVRDNGANSSCSTRRMPYELYKLLQNYRELRSFEDLVRVFPSAAKYYRDEEIDAGFLLAMVALEEDRFIFTQLFGLELLFEIISDPERAIGIKRLYGFDYKDFIALTAMHDVFCVLDIASLNGHIADLNQALAERDWQITMLVEERDKILNSRSWRFTRPLRFLRRKTGDLLRSKEEQGATDEVLGLHTPPYCAGVRPAAAMLSGATRLTTEQTPKQALERKRAFPEEVEL
jgi:glycosyltransferase involved in cell wall biosynthesis